MILYPDDIKKKVEFDRVIEAIMSECLSDMGKEYFENIEITNNYAKIQRLLNEVDEYKKAIERAEIYPLHSFESISEDVKYLRKEGYVLDIESIRNIYVIISIALDLLDYFSIPERVKMSPLIGEIVTGMVIDRKVVDEIDRVLDDEGEVRPDASPQLLKLSKDIRNKERELEKIFNQELEEYKTKGFLADTLESLRHGRRVLTVASEHKRKIQGIVHDESGTGKTFYIEPERVIPINNLVQNLYAERRHEIYKILRDLCSFIRPYSDTLLDLQSTLINLDTIRAKARFANRIDAGKPTIHNRPTLGYKSASNPVLLLRKEETGKEVIPFDLRLFGNNRILILSGPNAGGKSVALKSVGLLQLMLQAGIPIPADENSEMGIFSKIFVDIGDQQSLEDDLSTYSSHLKNMKKTTENADKNSLILIDEFGSGTDPKIGGAIAEAILKNINHKKSFGLITTHYSNLKYFAYKTQGLVNGYMEFDKMYLKPTFKMHIGRPGSSFAYEIAEKTGLDPEIIKYAQHKTGKNEKAIDGMLISLMSEKKEIEEKMATIIEKQDRLDKLIQSYEQMSTDLDIKKRQLKLKSKQEAALTALEQNREAKKFLKELRKIKDQEKVAQKADELKEKQEKAFKELELAKKQVFEDERKVTSRRIIEGTFVRMRNGTASGEVVRINRGMAEIQMGFIKVNASIEDLIAIDEPIKTKKKSIITNISTQDKIDNQIDIREYTKHDALEMLQEFLDKALLHNAYEIKIIHGIGTGVMKNEVRKMLREYKDVSKVWHPAPEEGGEGVTLVQF